MFSTAIVPSPPSRIPLSFSNPKSSFHGIRIANLRPVQTPPPLRRNPSSVVMMAKREEELKEIRSKTTEEINEEIVDLKGELFMLRLQKSARSEFKSSEFGRMRKRVARMLTVRREREIVEGINKRLSRKLDWKWKKSIVVRPPPSLKKLQEEQKAAEAEKSGDDVIAAARGFHTIIGSLAWKVKQPRVDFCEDYSRVRKDEN